jgi:hypothetical protein
MSQFQSLSNLSPLEVVVILTLAFWTIVWKGIALWISARENNKLWFIFLLMMNTFGILEIMFIYIISTTGKNRIKNWRARRFKKDTQVHVVDENSGNADVDQKSETQNFTDSKPSEQ